MNSHSQRREFDSFAEVKQLYRSAALGIRNAGVSECVTFWKVAAATKVTWMPVLAGMHQKMCMHSPFKSKTRLCSPHGHQLACNNRHHAEDTL